MKRECEEKERSLESLRKEAQELSLLNQEKKVSNKMIGIKHKKINILTLKNLMPIKRSGI